MIINTILQGCFLSGHTSAFLTFWKFKSKMPNFCGIYKPFELAAHAQILTCFEIKMELLSYFEYVLDCCVMKWSIEQWLEKQEIQNAVGKTIELNANEELNHIKTKNPLKFLKKKTFSKFDNKKTEWKEILDYSDILLNLKKRRKNYAFGKNILLA